MCMSLLAPLTVDAASPPKFITAKHAVAAPEAAARLCQTYSWACSAQGARVSAGSSADLAALKQVNASINRSVREITDESQFRVLDHWTLPTSKGGDCEDFALLKKQHLMQMGFPAKSLLIATVLDRQRQGHAVLVVRTSHGDLVLDNLTNKIKYWDDTGYMFLRMQNPNAPSTWIMVGASG